MDSSGRIHPLASAEAIAALNDLEREKKKGPVVPLTEEQAAAFSGLPRRERRARYAELRRATRRAARQAAR